MKPDPSGLPNTFVCDPGEKILVVTTVDHPPFLAQFPPAPIGATWLSAVVDQVHLTDTRTFQCPSSVPGAVIFQASYDEAIVAGVAPYTSVKYSTTISSLTNPHDPPISAPIVVQQGQGPTLEQYTFNVV
jgi:hypothetical protein